MKRSLRCTLALGAVIAVSAGCTATDPVGPEPITTAATTPSPTPPGDRGGDGALIYLLQVGSTQGVPLTTGSSPVWSPDGARIAFSSKRTGVYDLYVIDRDGSGLARLTHDGVSQEPNWSPDGRRIAWISEGSLNVMNSDGTNQITLARSTPLFSKLRMGAWSPDGRTLAFADPADGNIHLAIADGSGVLTLPFSGAAPIAVFQRPTWSPEGKRIAFVAVSACSANATSYCIGIHVMPAQGGAATLLAGNETEDDERPIWSPDGSRIAFLTYPGGDCGYWCDRPNLPELHVMNADGTGRRQLATGVVTWPAWSADGNTVIVSTSDSTSNGARMVAMPATGGPAQLLASSAGVMSPDGRWIALGAAR